MDVFKNLGLDVEVVNILDKDDIEKKIIKKIKNVDIDNITPVNALNILNELRGMLDE